MANRAGATKRSFMPFLLVFTGAFISMDFRVLPSAAQSMYKNIDSTLHYEERNGYTHLNNVFLHS